jgi:hypothetical protein
MSFIIVKYTFNNDSGTEPLLKVHYFFFINLTFYKKLRIVDDIRTYKHCDIHHIIHSINNIK